MFQSLTPFVFTPEWRPKLVDAEQALARRRFVACGPHQRLSSGFVPPRGLEHTALIESVEGCWIMVVMAERREVPAQVVDRVLHQRVQKIFADGGASPGRKQRALMRQEVVNELLPRAFPKREPVPIWIDWRARLLFVGASSDAKCQRVIGLLVETFERVAFATFDTAEQASKCMRAWLQHGDPPGNFTIDDGALLRCPVQARAAVKYTHVDLHRSQVRQHLAEGLMPAKLAMTWRSRLKFELREDLALLRIALAQAEAERHETAQTSDTEFDVFWAAALPELAGLFHDLVDALGGPQPDLFAGDRAETCASAASERAV